LRIGLAPTVTTTNAATRRTPRAASQIASAVKSGRSIRADPIVLITFKVDQRVPPWADEQEQQGEGQRHEHEREPRESDPSPEAHPHTRSAGAQEHGRRTSAVRKQQGSLGDCSACGSPARWPAAMTTLDPVAFAFALAIVVIFEYRRSRRRR
jgi:hypothetical protein